MNFRKFYLFFVLISFSAIENVSGQKMYIEQSGTIVFEASKSMIEEVKATNSTVSSILNSDNGEIAALALMTGFKFKNSLMEEHFNENYVESETYPKATFKGQLVGIDINKLAVEPSEINIIGKLSLHGKEKEIDFLAFIKRVKDKISLKGTFMVSPSDFDIKIPSIVGNKIAERVTVSIDFNFSEK